MNMEAVRDLKMWFILHTKHSSPPSLPSSCSSLTPPTTSTHSSERIRPPIGRLLSLACLFIDSIKNITIKNYICVQTHTYSIFSIVIQSMLYSQKTLGSCHFPDLFYYLSSCYLQIFWHVNIHHHARIINSLE